MDRYRNKLTKKKRNKAGKEEKKRGKELKRS